jgi:alanyl-tRNA synthetase
MSDYTATRLIEQAARIAELERGLEAATEIINSHCQHIAELEAENNRLERAWLALQKRASADRVVELEALCEAEQASNHRLSAKELELELENKALREVTLELANDVEAYADAERCDRFAYPHIMAKWESDMEPVRKARALLQEQGE